MKTTHQLARELLELPDVQVQVEGWCSIGDPSAVMSAYDPDRVAFIVPSHVIAFREWLAKQGDSIPFAKDELPLRFNGSNEHPAKVITVEEVKRIMERAAFFGHVRVIDIPIGPGVWPSGLGETIERPQ